MQCNKVRELTASYLFLLLSAFLVFMIGIHNVDNAWNMNTFNHYLEMKNDSNIFAENGLYSKNVLASDAYMQGMFFVITGFWLGVFFAFRLGKSLEALNRQDKHDESFCVRVGCRRKKQIKKLNTFLNYR